MADDKISALPAAAAVALTDIFPLDHTGVTSQATITQVRAAIVPIVLTADVSGVLPTANQASQAMAGDVTGTTAASVVAKVNGITISGTPAIGNQPVATSTSAAAWAALDLAGGSGYVTGALPAANQASQTMAGDVTGTTAASVVAKVNGATVPAAGALTVNTVMVVNGASALGYSAITNAHVSSAAAIASSKVVQATGTGIPHIVSGALVPASSLIVDADVSATAAIAGTKISPNFGSQTVQTSGPAIIGTASPPTTGDLRVGSSFAAKFLSSTSADLPLLTVVSDSVYVGDWQNGLNTNAGLFGAGYAMCRGTSGTLIGDAAGTYWMQVDSSNVYISKPIVGGGGFPAASPYSVHGKTTVATTGSFTVASSDYAFDAIQFTSAAGGTVTFPLPASDAKAYYKTIIYSGNGSLVVTNGGGAPKNVTLSANTTQRLLFDTVGVHPVSAAVAYP